MMTEKPHDEPSEVSAEDGDVIVDGPDGVAVSFTPQAAAETGDRLLFNSAKARGQQMAGEERKRAKPVSDD